MSDQRNLIIAIALSVGVILGFQFFYEIPRLQEQQMLAEQEAATQAELQGGVADSVTPGTPGTDVSGVQVPGSAAAIASQSREAALGQDRRIEIDNGRLHGSLSTRGLRIDDLTLADYQEENDLSSPEIELLGPAGSRNTYFAEYGWVAADAGVTVPDEDTVWASTDDRLTSAESVQFGWDNGQGLSFGKSVALDEDYMFTVVRSVTNNGDEAVTLLPYSLISRWETPETSGFYILHEGPIGVLEEQLREVDYSDLIDDGDIEVTTNGGWLGITDKYWLTAMITDGTPETKATYRHNFAAGSDRYQVDLLGQAVTIQPGQTYEHKEYLFAGAKEVDKLDAYSAEYNIPLFDRAVDFGWFYFLTKPIFHALIFFHSISGNYGVAILILTLVVKALFFPLANKSYKSMSAMKKLQPEMQKIKERAGDDRQKMQQELMALYKKEKVNPMSGCLPILVQIPVFFALYKVLFVAIEMRHAPFFGWIQDLSAPDPTSLFNLFGLIPFDPPGFLMIGVWPLLMGITMFLQTRLNPQPPDPIQAKIMLFLPLMFIFLFATFPAGLVIYWTWNNLLSILQQWIIMRKMGVKAG